MIRPKTWRELPYPLLEALLYRAPIVAPEGYSMTEAIEEIANLCCNELNDAAIQKFYTELSDQAFAIMCELKLQLLEAWVKESKTFISNL